MSATVLFPDAELVAVEYLRNQFDILSQDVTVGTIKPSPQAEGGTIQVRRVGGTRETVVTDKPRVDLLCWHDTDADAAELAELARALLTRPRREGGFDADEFAGPARFADPDSDQPRYLLTVEFVTRGTALEPSGS